MLFFMTYYFVRFFFGGTYWIISNSASGIYHLIKYNQTIKQNKNKEKNIHYDTLLLEDK